MSKNLKTINMIEIHDSLAEFLGYPFDGKLKYTFDDVVKLTGHACPTAASTYIMLKVGLEKLYINTFPERGNLKINIKGNKSEGVNGVIGAISTFITGASGEEGFQGIGQKFSRKNRITFNHNQEYSIIIERDDSGQRVGINFLMHKVPVNQLINEYLQLLISGNATEEIQEAFKNMWQSRVQWILNQQDYSDIVECTYLQG